LNPDPLTQSNRFLPVYNRIHNTCQKAFQIEDPGVQTASQKLKRNTVPFPGSDSVSKKVPKRKNVRKIMCFGSKTTIYLSLGLHKVRPSYKRGLQLAKENIQHFKI
jgi:hypothetical protein